MIKFGKKLFSFDTADLTKFHFLVLFKKSRKFWMLANQIFQNWKKSCEWVKLRKNNHWQKSRIDYKSKKKMPCRLWHWERIVLFSIFMDLKSAKITCLHTFAPFYQFKKNGRLKNSWFQMSSFASYMFKKKQIQFRSIRKLLSYFTKNKTKKAFSYIGCSKITILTYLWLRCLRGF